MLSDGESFPKLKKQKGNKIPTTAASNESKSHFCGPLESELEVLTSDLSLAQLSNLAHGVQLEMNGLKSILMRGEFYR